MEQITGYLIKHWKGEFSLARSIWLNGLLGGILTNILRNAFRDSIDPLLAYVLWYGIIIYLLVGIFNSADKHENYALKFFIKALTIISICSAIIFSFFPFL
jgi:cytochrome bd-type quinol oxidase subunit 2